MAGDGQAGIDGTLIESDRCLRLGLTRWWTYGRREQQSAFTTRPFALGDAKGTRNTDTSVPGW